MKPSIHIAGNVFKTNFRKAIALLFIVAVANVSPANAQERGQEHRNGNNRPQMNNNHSQEMRQGRSQPMQPSQPRLGNPGGYGGVNQNRTYQPNRSLDAGSSRQYNGNNNPAGRTVINSNRTNNATYNTSRTNIRVINRGNYARPAYSANNPAWHYANLPRRNAMITTIPSTYRTINYGGYNYRYNHGVFYRPYNNSFMVVAPPVGIYIDVLPVGYSRIMVGNYPYYYYNGTYYDYRDNNYLVVSPPVGAIVESLPAGYETLTVDGETYYTVDGAQYKPVVQENGEVWYEVIKAN